MTRAILIGLPGSGKDTVGSILSEDTGIPLISLGDLLRSYLKGKWRKALDRGDFIPDEIIYRILTKKTSGLKSYILNGFPRKLNQAENLERLGGIDEVFFLDITVRESIKRLSNRYVCPSCDFVSKKDGLCGNCGDKLTKRKDDAPEVVKKRIKLYKKETIPVLEFYRERKKLFTIKGRNSMAIAKKIEKIIKENTKIKRRSR